MRTKNLTICTVVVLLLTTSIGFADLSVGLVGYWSFDNAGNPAYDDSGNGHDGTVLGVSTTGIVGNAMSFDGANGYIEVPHSDMLNPENLTVSLWVSHNAQDYGASNVMIDKCIWDPDLGYFLSYSNSKGLYFAVNDDEYRHISNVHPELNTWTHFVATYERATGITEIFVNGI